MEPFKILEPGLDNLHIDDRGWVVNPTELARLLPGEMDYVHMVSLEEGKIRGNHYHTGSTEWLLICNGEVVVKWKNLDDDMIRTHALTVKKPVLLEFGDYVVHAVKNTDSNTVFMLAFCSRGERETIRCESLF